MNKNKKTENHYSLASDSIRRILVLGIVLVITTCITSGFIMYRRLVSLYSELSYSSAKNIAETVYGKNLEDYRLTGESDDKYTEFWLIVSGVSRFSDFYDTYIVYPKQNKVLYFFDVIRPDNDYNEEQMATQKGFLEERDYLPKEKEIMRKILLTGEYEEKLYWNIHKKKGDLLYTALVPVYGYDGIITGLAGIDISMDRVFDTIGSMYLNTILVFIIVMFAGTMIYYKAVKRKVIDPILKLKDATSGMVDNLDTNKEFTVDIHTRDEIQDLAESFEQMNINLRSYINKNMEMAANEEKLRTELDLATKIQVNMLPRIFPAFPERNEIDIYASMDPAKEVGGDFYDFFFTDDDHLALVIADVSGKGIPGALFMMMSMIVIKNLIMSDLSPKDALMRMNHQICSNNKAGMFVTIWVGILDLKSGKLVAANAGHEKPILKNGDGKYEVIDDKHGFVIGGMDGVKYDEYELTLEKGSKLFLYTDGLAEATDKDDNLFGMERIIETLNEKDGSPKEVLENMQKSVNQFVKDAPQFDDLTMMCVEYKGK